MILAAAGLIAGRLIMLAGALAGTCYRLFYFLLAAAGSRLAVGFGMCLSAGAGTITGNGFLFGAGACYRLAAAGCLPAAAGFLLNMVFSA